MTLLLAAKRMLTTTTAMTVRGKTSADGKLWKGSPVVQLIKERIRQKGTLLKKTPHLAILCTNYREDSQIYVDRKVKALQEFGFQYTISNADTLLQQEQVLKEWNCSKDIDGILIQLPVSADPDDAMRLKNHLCLEKDVDGMMEGSPYTPCTAAAVMELLTYHNVQIRGAEVVVIGKGNQVGLPIAKLLINSGATVTVVHKATKYMEAHLKRAEIIISAAGSPGLLNATHLQEGCIVIDVGITRTKENKICGDVMLSNELLNKVKAVTPVPGGIGPITVGKLVENLVLATLNRNPI